MIRKGRKRNKKKKKLKEKESIGKMEGEKVGGHEQGKEVRGIEKKVGGKSLTGRAES